MGKEIMKTKTRIRFGFKSKTQAPFFMLWREFWENGEVVYADTIFVTPF